MKKTLATLFLVLAITPPAFGGGGVKFDPSAGSIDVTQRPVRFLKITNKSPTNIPGYVVVSGYFEGNDDTVKITIDPATGEMKREEIQRIIREDQIIHCDDGSDVAVVRDDGQEA